MKKSLPLSIAALLYFGALTAQITVPLVLTTSVTAATLCTAPCNGTATVVSVTGGTAPYTYLWNPTGQMTATATGLCPGQYQVGVFDSSVPQQLGQALVTITCVTATAINEVVNSNNDVIIFPSPADGEVYLQANFDVTTTMNITVYNVLGAVLHTETADLRAGNTHVMNVSDLPSGIYTIDMNNEGEMIRKKFVKK